MKKPVILLLILAGLIVFAFFYQESRAKNMNSARLSGVKSREYVFPNLAVSNIRKIKVREGAKQVTLSISGDRWTVAERNDYTASFDKIKRAVESLAGLKVTSKQSIGKSALGEIKLLAPGEGTPEQAGLQVELLNDKDEIIATLIAGQTINSTGGSSSGNMMGGPGEQRVVRTLKDENTVWTIGDSLYELQPDAGEWLDKAFLDVRALKSVQVTAPDAADSWSASRADAQGEFALIDAKAGEALDAAKASGIITVLANATFTDVLPKDQATPDFMKDAVTATLTTFEDFTYQVKVQQKKAEGGEEPKCYVSVIVGAEIPKERKPEPGEKDEDKGKLNEEFAFKKKTLEEKLAAEKALEGWVYDISSYSVNALLKKRSELLADKQPSANPAGGAPGFPPGRIPMAALPQLPSPPPAAVVPAPAPVAEKPAPKTEMPQAATKPVQSPAPEAPAKPKPPQ
ncbi:hypothetical protein BH11VER1_BH11VER1_16410 [soil metagenome]